MYKGIYKMAGRVIAICSIHQLVQQMCRDYRDGGSPDFTVTVTQADIDREREDGEKASEADKETLPEVTDAYLETLAVYRKICCRMLEEYDTLLFHGSAVAVDGKAYLFTATSGTGKSTHTRLWRQMLADRAVMVNDDKPLLRITPEQVLVCGTPWDGKHRISTNICVPLQAICILERGEKNSIQQITVHDALPMLLQQSFRPAAAKDYPRYLSLMDMLAGRLEFYRLRCNMDPEAARVAYEKMAKVSEEK